MVVDTGQEDPLRSGNRINELLPYYAELSLEAEQFLTEIKERIAKAIVNAELRPGLTSWLFHLKVYIRMYGFRIPKKDHIELVQLLINTIILPDLNFGTVEMVAAGLCDLLAYVNPEDELRTKDSDRSIGSRQLLSRQDLTIEWRPLHDLLSRVTDGKLREHGLLHCSTRVGKRLTKLIGECRTYFPLTATKEILDEWLVEICPYDEDQKELFGLFETFLPTNLGPEHDDVGWKLWFDQFMAIWRFDRRGNVENALGKLFSRLAIENIGRIDWEPYLPEIFTRLSRFFNLPYSSGNIKMSRRGGSQVVSVYLTTWIVACYGGSQVCRDHLTQLFRLTESFYHPSNSGTWARPLNSFLARLCQDLVTRLWFERNGRDEWVKRIPESRRINEEDIDHLVEVVRPIVMTTIFSRSAEAPIALRALASLRPTCILPILEKLNDALCNVTEPHRLISLMKAMEHLTRLLVVNNLKFEEPVDIPGLLMACLPGIDLNDLRKTQVTLRLITSIVVMIRLEDCSSIADDVDPSLHRVCVSTGLFEDFVLEFLSRCFILIENLVSETNHQRESQTTSDSKVLEAELRDTANALFNRCSPQIYYAALDELRGFVTSRILDPCAGKLAIVIVRSAVSANPEFGLKTFLPHFGKLALTLMEPEEVMSEERLDNELWFSLFLLSEMVLGAPDALHPHLPLITSVVKRSQQLTSRQGYGSGSRLLACTLLALTTLQPLLERLPMQEKRLDVADPPVLHWGEGKLFKDCKVNFYIPGDADMAAAKQLFDEGFVPNLLLLREWCHNPVESPLTKTECERALTIVRDSATGLSASLPVLEGDFVNILDLKAFENVRNPLRLKQKAFPVADLRQTLVNDMSRVVDTLLTHREDDIRSAELACRIIRVACVFSGQVDADKRKATLEEKRLQMDLRLWDRVNGFKHLDHLIHSGVVLQNEVHLNCRLTRFTEYFVKSIKLLFRMAISRYPAVRVCAQDILSTIFGWATGSAKVIVDDVCALLVNPDMTHEQYKGILYTVFGNGESSIVSMHNWEVTSRLWPALVNAKHSEKPSVVGLLIVIQEAVVAFNETCPLEQRVPKELAEQALAMAGLPQNVTVDTVVSGIENRDIFQRLLDQLTQDVQKATLHWRHYQLGMTMIRQLLRHDVEIPLETARLAINQLVSDQFCTRYCCIDILTAVLYQQKKKMKRRTITRGQLLKINESIPLNAHFERCLTSARKGAAGTERPGNLLLQLNSANYPTTQEKWDEAIFVHKSHIGYSGFADEIEIVAPDSEQPLPAGPGNMNDTEDLIFRKFSDADFVKKLLALLALDERKKGGTLEEKRVLLFKLLSQNYCDAFLETFFTVVTNILTESHLDVEHKTALNLLAGFIRGAKHWNFEKTQKLAAATEEVFEKGQANMVTQETVNDWATLVATGLQHRDCNKYSWFIEIVSKDIFSGTSVKQSARMFCLIGALSQVQWRSLELCHRLLDEIVPNLAHPNLDIRRNIANILSYILSYGIRTNDGELSLFDREENFVLAPKGVDFLHSVLSHITETRSEKEDQEKEIAHRIFQTLMKWQAKLCAHTTMAILPKEVLALLPFSLKLMAETTNEEMKRDCAMLVAVYGNQLLTGEALKLTLDSALTIMKESMWKVKTMCISLVMFTVYSNLFMVSKEKELTEKVKTIILKGIYDERLEVQATANEGLSSLIHCGLFDISSSYINTQKKEVSRVSRELRAHRAEKRKHFLEQRGKIDSAGDTNDLIRAEKFSEKEKHLISEYHSVVMILSSYILAHPYDVPELMPDVICVLAEHVNAPQPIMGTIKKTLTDFKRTHIDNWRDHKQNFSEEQLAVITDLLVSPSYYA